MWVRYVSLPLPFLELKSPQFNYGLLVTTIGEWPQTRGRRVF